MDAPVAEKPRTEIVSSGRTRTTSLPAKPDYVSQSLQACKSATSLSGNIIAQLESNIAERERIQKKNNEIKDVVHTLASAIGTLREDITLLKESAAVVAELDTQRENQIELIVGEQQTQRNLYAGASDRLTKINEEYLEILPHVKNLQKKITDSEQKNVSELEKLLTRISNLEKQQEETQKIKLEKRQQKERILSENVKFQELSERQEKTAIQNSWSTRSISILCGAGALSAAFVCWLWLYMHQ